MPYDASTVSRLGMATGSLRCPEVHLYSGPHGGCASLGMVTGSLGCPEWSFSEFGSPWFTGNGSWKPWISRSVEPLAKRDSVGAWNGSWKPWISREAPALARRRLELGMAAGSLGCPEPALYRAGGRSRGAGKGSGKPPMSRVDPYAAKALVTVWKGNGKPWMSRGKQDSIVGDGLGKGNGKPSMSRYPSTRAWNGSRKPWISREHSDLLLVLELPRKGSWKPLDLQSTQKGSWKPWISRGHDISPSVWHLEALDLQSFGRSTPQAHGARLGMAAGSLGSPEPRVSRSGVSPGNGNGKPSMSRDVKQLWMFHTC